MRQGIKSEALLRGFDYQEVMLSEMSDRLGDIVKEMLDTVDEPTSDEAGVGNVAPGYVHPSDVIEAIKRIALKLGKNGTSGVTIDPYDVSQFALLP